MVQGICDKCFSELFPWFFSGATDAGGDLETARRIASGALWQRQSDTTAERSQSGTVSAQGFSLRPQGQKKKKAEGGIE
jgi:hypothetical protein